MLSGNNRRISGGLTLLEVLFSIGILLLLSTLSFLYFSRANYAERLSKSRMGVVAMLAEARSLSAYGKSASRYGVHIDTDGAVLYKGDTYSPSATDNKEFILLNGIIATYSINGGGADILFSRIDGSTSNYGLITLSQSSSPFSTSTITVRSTGVIQ